MGADEPRPELAFWYIRCTIRTSCRTSQRRHLPCRISIPVTNRGTGRICARRCPPRSKSLIPELRGFRYPTPTRSRRSLVRVFAFHESPTAPT